MSNKATVIIPEPQEFNKGIDSIFPRSLSCPGEAESAVTADLRPEYVVHL